MTKLGGYDAWNVACFFGGINCPTPAGPDFDFGQGAMLIPTKINGQAQDVLAAGQKSGVFWGINPNTGAVIWQTADPNCFADNGIDPGAVSVANGVVYAGSLARPATAPTFFALNAANGKIKWQYASGGSVNSGAAIVDGIVYWGSGYSNFGLGSANNKFYAFGLK